MVICSLILLLLLPAARASDSIRFIQPKAAFAIAGYTGVLVPVQVRVERHPDNRALAIVWDGDGCGGRHVRTLNGEDERVIHPPTPLSVRIYPGTCTFVAAVLGPGGKIRGRAEFTVTVK